MAVHNEYHIAAVKKSYEDVISITEDGGPNVSTNMDKIMQVLDNTIVVSENHMDAEQLLYEAKLTQAASQYLHQAASDIKVGEFDIGDFAARLRTRVTDPTGKLDWRLIEAGTNKVLRPLPPALTMMLGAFSNKVVPAIKERKRRSKEPLSQKVEPQMVNKNAEKDKVKKENLKRVYGVIKSEYLRTQQPLSYLHLVLHPTSFDHTIHNIFHVAFLISDGLVSMACDDNGLPTITPLTKQEKVVSKEVPMYQKLICISPYEWQQMVKNLDLKTATIPHN